MTTRLDRIEARVHAIIAEGDIAVDDVEAADALALIRVARLADAYFKARDTAISQLDWEGRGYAVQAALAPLLEEV